MYVCVYLEWPFCVKILFRARHLMRWRSGFGQYCSKICRPKLSAAKMYRRDYSYW